MTQSLKPSIRLMTSCVSLNRPRCSGLRKPRREPSARGGAPAADRGVPRPWRCKASRLLGEERDLPLEPLAHVGPQPRVGLELEGVRGLVQRHPQAEVIDRHAARARAVARMFSSTYSSRPGSLLGREQRDVILTQHATAEVAQQEAHLAGGDEAIGGRGDAVASAALRRPWCEVWLEVGDQRLEGAHVGTGPVGPTDDGVTVHDPGQLCTKALLEERHDPVHVAGVGRLAGLELARGETAGSWRRVLGPSARRAPSRPAQLADWRPRGWRWHGR